MPYELGGMLWDPQLEINPNYRPYIFSPYGLTPIWALPSGPKPIWAKAHMGQGPYGPGPIWVQTLGPSLSRRNPHQKTSPEKRGPGPGPLPVVAKPSPANVP